MKRFVVAKIKLPLFVVLFTSIAFNAIGQKLPKIQTGSLLAPFNIKIDAKTTEWNDRFQAYNTNNRIYYTISNDDYNLYLLVRASDDYANEKAIFGITFKITLPAEKSRKTKENVAVMFPTENSAQKHNPIRVPINFVGRLKKDTGDLVKKNRKIDSLRSIINKRLSDTFKEIGITGIPDIPETAISIYNTEGIKVAAQLDDHSLYIYELAIPLKFLGALINSGQKFKYKIVMNGPSSSGPNAPPIIMDDNGQQHFGSPDNAYIMSETYFSGEYTLAKK